MWDDEKPELFSLRPVTYANILIVESDSCLYHLPEI